MLLALGAVAVFAGPGAASWDMHSELTGTIGTLDLYVLVEYDNGEYIYTYELTATDINSSVHAFDVGNPDQLPFYDADNWGADYDFQNPEYHDYLTSLTWAYGELSQGNSAWFTFKSRYGPDVVATSVLDTGRRAEGLTLGMVIPEPGLTGLVGLAAMGLAAIRMRRT